MSRRRPSRPRPGYKASHDNASRDKARDPAAVPAPALPPASTAPPPIPAPREGDDASALAAARRALRRRPDDPEALARLGEMLARRQALDQAAAAVQRACALVPSEIRYLNMLGGIYRLDGLLDAAAAMFSHVLAVAPYRVECLCNLALSHRDLGEIERCNALFDRALAVVPASQPVQRLTLSTVAYDPHVTPEQYFAPHRRFGRDAAASLAPHRRPLTNTPDPRRRLRIGYLSSDFRDHPVARNLEPLLVNRAQTDRDSAGTELYFYADCPSPDAVTQRFRGIADGWRDVAGMTDPDIAAQIRADAIDILVVLASRFDDNRPLVAACRAAPVQISFHDVATSGLAAMDYLIADRVLVPRHSPERFTERVLRLPGFYLHAPIAGSPDPGPAPCLANGHLTFACFANPSKINDAVLAWWGIILRAVPDARLLLRFYGYYRSERLRRRMVDGLAAQGVDSGRIRFLDEKLPIDGHLALYRDVDIALDTFPFCGSTTSFEALWMGVPVLTLPGFSMVSRWTASILEDISVAGFVATSAEHAGTLAAGWARAPQRLAALRGALRGRILASPLVDGGRKARHLDRLYRAVWRRWCRAQRRLPAMGELLQAAVAAHFHGKPAAAAAGCAAVLALDPVQGDALHLLGLSRAATGDFAIGIQALRRALVAGCAAAAGNLINALINRAAVGKQTDTAATGLAVSGLQTALALDPAHEDAWNGLATWRRRAEAGAVAMVAVSRALRIAPANWRAWWNAGRIAEALDRRAEARSHFRRALALDPANAEVWTDLGRLDIDGHRAESRLRRALRCRADLIDALNNLVFLIRGRGDLDVAGTLAGRAVALDPVNAAALNSLGVTLRDAGLIDAALACFERLCRAAPDSHDGLCNLSLLRKDIGDITGSLALLARADAAHPLSAVVQRLSLWAVACDPAADPERHFAVHRRFADRSAPPVVAMGATALPPMDNDPNPERRIRIGYLSSDLRDHPVARNLLPMIAGRDPTRTALHFYANCRRPDGMTERLRADADGWRDVDGLSDAEIAAQIRADGIDVLVILAGRFDDNRPLVAAYRAAPVQISLFDAATSGIPQMDYILTDRVMTPRDHAERFSERPLRLPTLFAYAPPGQTPDPGPPPMERNGYVTFASFNNPAKLNDTVLALWARLLNRLPGSRLHLHYRNWFGSAALRRRVTAVFAAHGIDGARVIFIEPPLDRQSHLDLYKDVDIALDPFPFGGATTNFEALSMGVPVITLPGFTMMSRWTASMLTAIGLEQTIAADPDDFLHIAGELAGNPGQLTHWRRTLKNRLTASPVCNGTGKSRQLDRLYRAVWRRWCASRTPVKDAQGLLAAAVDRHRHGHLVTARALYCRVLALEPMRRDALFLLGMIHGTANRHGAAARLAWRAWLAGHPAAEEALATALNNLGATQNLRTASLKGAAYLRTAIALMPLRADAWNNLGGLLRRAKRHDDSFRVLQWTLQMLPDHQQAHWNLGLLAMEMGDVALGLAALQRAVDLAVEGSEKAQVAHRHVLWAVLCEPSYSEERRFAEHRRFAAIHARPLAVHQRPFTNLPDPGRRLKVGYVSSDFRSHSLSRNLLPLIQGCDRARLAAYFYADCPQPDAVTAAFRALADGWHDIEGRSDAEIAEMVRADGIDILVLLAGRFDENRPLVAACRAAPVQVSLYDGATSGLDEMDYILTDRVMTPRHGAERFTERPVRLPTLFTYATIDEAPDPGPPPCLTTGYPTFASFNNPAKLNDAVLDLWGRMLAAIPGSRIMLRYMDCYKSAWLRRRVLSAFARHGVTPQQVTISDDTLNQQEHLELYRRIDIALDPFPFGGATTSFEALWLGIPVITLPQSNMMSRWTASLLTMLDVPALIAGTERAYIDIAAGLSADPQRLVDMRRTLGRRLAASPVCNAGHKGRHFERALRAMWRRWCRNDGFRGTF